MKNKDKCPNCGDDLIHPRIGTPYCEDCGYPDEDRLEYPETIRVVNPEDESIFALIMHVDGESGHYAWYAIDDETGKMIGSGSDDDKADSVRNAINRITKYERKAVEG